MTDKHSSIHPALRSDRVTLPWKRRRRIEFSAWPPLTIDAGSISAAAPTRVHPSHTVAETLRRGNSLPLHPAMPNTPCEVRDEDVPWLRLTRPYAIIDGA